MKICWYKKTSYKYKHL